MIQQDYFLKKYGVEFDPNDTPEEKLSRMTRGFGVHESYEGNEPYIFVSYAHLDSALVLPAVKAIQEAGYPVWYDAGISPGSEWAADIAQHLKNSSLVIAFVSQNAFDSPNCRAEIVYAFGQRKPMLTVQLDQAPLPDGLDMQLSLSQMFKAFAYDDGDSYVQKLSKAPILEEKVSPILKKLKEEEAERQRQAEEEALRERREAEEAERRYQQAKEAARQRREAEAAEQKRWEAEKQQQEAVKRQQMHAQKEREESSKRKQESADAGRQLNAEREKQRKLIQAEFAKAHALAKKQTYSGCRQAISIFNSANTYEVHSLIPDEVQEYGEQLSATIYHSACQMEKDPKQKRDAARLMCALNRYNTAAGLRGGKILDDFARREKINMFLICVIYVIAQFVLSSAVLHLVRPWYLKTLLMIAPMLLMSGCVILVDKVFHGKTDNIVFALLVCLVLTAVVDPFLFCNTTFWIRILSTLGYSALNLVIWFAALGYLMVSEDEINPLK